MSESLLSFTHVTIQALDKLLETGVITKEQYDKYCERYGYAVQNCCGQKTGDKSDGKY